MFKTFFTSAKVINSYSPVIWNFIDQASIAPAPNTNTLTGVGNLPSSGQGVPSMTNTGAGFRGGLDFGITGPSPGSIGWFNSNGTRFSLDFGIRIVGLNWVVVVAGSTAGQPTGACTVFDRMQVDVYDDHVVWSQNGYQVHTLPVSPMAATYRPAANFDAGSFDGFETVTVSGRLTRPLRFEDWSYIGSLTSNGVNTINTTAGNYTQGIELAFTKGIHFAFPQGHGGRWKIFLNGELVQWDFSFPSAISYDVSGLSGVNLLQIFFSNIDEFVIYEQGAYLLL